MREKERRKVKSILGQVGIESDGQISLIKIKMELFNMLFRNTLFYGIEIWG